MRELPILMNGAMVRAVLDGRKTVTRRVIKSIPWRPGVNPNFSQARAFSNGREFRIAGSEEMTTGFRCPYGAVGDRLYVRETAFRVPHPAEVGLTPDDMPRTWDQACDIAGQILYSADMEERTAKIITDGQPWTPSIHMPKAWARIWLEVTAVRVERLRDISEEQAHEEGVDNHMAAAAVGTDSTRGELLPATVHGFAHLWDGLAKPGTRWADNPWVWAVAFKRVDRATA